MADGEGIEPSLVLSPGYGLASRRITALPPILVQDELLDRWSWAGAVAMVGARWGARVALSSRISSRIAVRRSRTGTGIPSPHSSLDTSMYLQKFIPEILASSCCRDFGDAFEDFLGMAI